MKRMATETTDGETALGTPETAHGSLEQTDREIFDLLRVINWHRIARALAFGGPVTAGIGALFALCLVSIGAGYAVLAAREALSPDIAAVPAIAGVVLFLILAGLRALVLGQLRPLAAQTGGKLTNDINASRAKELAAEARDYYARHGEPLKTPGLPALLALLGDLQSQRAAHAAEFRINTPGLRLLPCHAQPLALSALILLLCSFAPAFLVHVAHRETPLASTTARPSQPALAPSTPLRPSLAPNDTARMTMVAPSIPKVEPSPTHQTESVYDRLRSFIGKHVAAEAARDLDAVMADYFDTVDYFDDGRLSRAQVRANKDVYFKRWSRGRETINGEIQLSKIAVGEWHATFPTTFRVENEAGEWIEGDATNDYQVEFIEGRLLITSQKVNVTRRQKSAPASMPNGFDVTAMTEFVTQLQRNEMSQNLDTIMKDYAPQVDYFDHGKVAHDFIRKDKSDYFRRWPKMQYQVTGNVEHKPLAPHRYRVTFPLRFRVESDVGEWIEGTAENTLELIEVGGRLKILGEKSRMIRREKGVSSPANGTPGLNVAPPAAPVVNARRFNGKGRVYKVPELKNLTGQKLQNAWFFGDFLFRGWNGNTGQFITTAIFILPKEGNTDVDIEFAGGISVSERTRAVLRDPMLVVPISVKAADPMELLEVTKQRNGRLRVRARYHGNLNL